MRPQVPGMHASFLVAAKFAHTHLMARLATLGAKIAVPDGGAGGVDCSLQLQLAVHTALTHNRPDVLACIFRPVPCKER